MRIEKINDKEVIVTTREDAKNGGFILSETPRRFSLEKLEQVSQQAQRRNESFKNIKKKL